MCVGEGYGIGDLGMGLLIVARERVWTMEVSESEGLNVRTETRESLDRQRLLGKWWRGEENGEGVSLF